jgi:Protein phosphatase 2C
MAYQHAQAGRESAPTAWAPITVDRPSDEFEARPPQHYAYEIPDTECDGWSTDRLTLRSASVRGARHRYYRQPRQDAVRAAAHEPSGTLVFAVADGVSSATDAELGAAEACRAAMEMMLLQLSQGDGPLDFQVVVRHAADRLYELTQWRLGKDRPEPAEVAGLFATTLTAGSVRPDSGGGRGGGTGVVSGDGPIVEVCRIGDSSAWILDRSSGRYHHLFHSKTAADVAVVSNEVAPLPQVPDQMEQTCVILPAHTALLVGTDGFGDPLGDGDGLIGRLFAAHLSQPPPPKWLAHVLDFSRETFDDDRTLLAVWPRDMRE